MKFLGIIYLIILFILLLSFGMLAQAPDTLWTKTYGGIWDDCGYSIQKCVSGGFIVAGYTTPDSGYPVTYLIRSDSLGDTLWTKTYDFGISDSWGNSVQECASGGFIIVGATGGIGAVYIIRTDSLGDTLWTKTYGGGPFTMAYSVQECASGGFIITGGHVNIFLMRTDSLGDTLWTKTYGGVQNDWGYSVNECSSGGFIIAGFTNSFGAGLYDVYLIRTDSIGDTLWTKTYGGTQDDRAYSIQECASGGFAIIGYTRSFGAAPRDVYLIRTDSFGDTLWTKTYEESDEFGKSIQVCESGGFIIAGGTADDVYIIRTDSLGSVIWSEIFGGTEDDVGHSVFASSNPPSYIIAGETSSYGAGGSDVWLLKVQPTPEAIISATDTFWIDGNFDGYAEGFLDGSSSVGAEGSSIITYLWFINGDIFDSTSQISPTLASGTHKISLFVTDEYGYEDSTSIFIHVHVFKIQTSGAIKAAVSAIEDTLFFASSEDDRVYHFTKDGSVQWTLWTGGDIQSTTTVGGDTILFVGSSDTRLYAFDTSGSFVWDLPMGGVVTASPALDPYGNIYVGVSNGKFFAVADTGEPKWNVTTGGPINTSAAISANDTIYVGSDDGKLYAIRQNGGIAWIFGTGGAIQSSPALDSAGNVYFGSDDGNLFAFSSSGDSLWSVQTGNMVRSSPIIGSDGNIYFGSNDGMVYAVSPQGQILWTYDAGNPVNGTGAISGNGMLYIGTGDGRLISLDTNLGDSLLWYYQTGAPIVSPPLITSYGMIIFGSDDGGICAMVDPNLLTAYPKASYVWPTFQANNRRTGNQSEAVFVKERKKQDRKPLKFSLTIPSVLPIKEQSKICYAIPKSGHVRLEMYNVLGQRVMILVNQKQTPGYYEIPWYLPTIGSGVYFFRLTAGDFSSTKKLILIR